MLSRLFLFAGLSLAVRPATAKPVRSYVALALATVQLLLLQPVAAADYSRYPYWLPEWLWKQGGPLARLVDEADRADLEKKIEQVRQLPNESSELSKLTYVATSAASEMFSGRDLRWGANVVSDTATGRQILVHLDPSFPDRMKPVLLKAIALFLNVATDPGVIEQALRQVDDHPEPFPPEDVKDQDKPTPNPAYQNYLQSLLRPTSAESFAADMNDALTLSSKNVPILIIARYDGNPWWGGGYYDYYFASAPRLKRLAPQGYFYIRLNSEKMTEGQIRFDDPSFWASKISHELLHNLGYWHPNYADPAERDRNTAKSAPFIIGYERAVLAKLDASK